MNEITYKRVFYQYYKHLYIFSTKYVDERNADDIVQDVFLKLWEVQKELESEEHIKLYLYKSVYNACINQIKHTQYMNRQLTQFQLDVEEYVEPDVNVDCVENNLLICIFDAIEQLPRKSREIFEMSYLDKMDIAEISRELGISANTIKSQRLRAKEALREILKKNIKTFLPLYMNLWIAIG